MTKTPQELREDARAIWDAAVAAVRSERLVRNVLACDAAGLTVCGETRRWSEIDRIAVVGAGKAGAGMAAAVEEILGPERVAARVAGWVNVPADCLRPMQRIRLHPARPAGVNEPTEAGVAGTAEILRIVGGLGPRDVCLVLLSGGGSALLPAPCEGITLADKQALTRALSTAGATIHELNTVRKQLSRVKGGRLGAACRAGRTWTLIISDVIGDPLDVIASGPTTPDAGTPRAALAILDQFGLQPPAIPASVRARLESLAAQPPAPVVSPPGLSNHIIGNNAVALAAAERAARARGYDVRSLGSDRQGTADDEGRFLIDHARTLQTTADRRRLPLCLLSGGEPTVRLAPTPLPRKGGRNQQLVLSALAHAWETGLPGIALLAGGTDGEDGPTDAAGAWIDQELWQRLRAAGTPPHADLAIQNAYPYFAAADALLLTGPTHTNVMDVRVATLA